MNLTDHREQSARVHRHRQRRAAQLLQILLDHRPARLRRGVESLVDVERREEPVWVAGLSPRGTRSPLVVPVTGSAIWSAVIVPSTR